MTKLDPTQFTMEELFSRIDSIEERISSLEQQKDEKEAEDMFAMGYSDGFNNGVENPDFKGTEPYQSGFNQGCDAFFKSRDN